MSLFDTMPSIRSFYYLDEDNTTVEPVLYMAIALNNKQWKLVFWDGKKRRQVAVFRTGFLSSSANDGTTFAAKHTFGGRCISLALLSCLVFSSGLGACASVLFYPSTLQVLTPAQFGVSYQDVYLHTLDDVRLHGWFLSSAGEAKATVFFLHGNAENISTHVRSVAWLPREGYQVFLVDYRGYGLSSGTPSLPEVFEDIDTGPWQRAVNDFGGKLWKTSSGSWCAPSLCSSC